MTTFNDGFIDLHCHILPGIDDGPEDLSESIEMTHMAKDDGISHIFATPHIIPGTFDNDTTTILSCFNNFKKHVNNGLSLFYGADVHITPDLLARLQKKEVPTLNDSPYLLIELPSYAMPLNLKHLLFNLKQNGTITIITHPERYLYFSDNLPGLKALREEGAMCQLTALSITGGFGKQIKKIALSMIEKGLVDFVSTDSHGVRKRPTGLSKAYREVARQFDIKIANRLFYDNPRKVLEAVK